MALQSAQPLLLHVLRLFTGVIHKDLTHTVKFSYTSVHTYSPISGGRFFQHHCDVQGQAAINVCTRLPTQQHALPSAATPCSRRGYSWPRHSVNQNIRSSFSTDITAAARTSRDGLASGFGKLGLGPKLQVSLSCACIAAVLRKMMNAFSSVLNIF